MVIFNLTNTPDGVFFNGSNTSGNTGGYWYYNLPDFTLNDSGSFTLMLQCIDTVTSPTQSVNWNIPWGTLQTYINDTLPNQAVSAEQNKTFTVTAGVRCVGGECGDVNFSLDPLEIRPRQPEADDGIAGRLLNALVSFWRLLLG